MRSFDQRLIGQKDGDSSDIGLFPLQLFDAGGDGRAHSFLPMAVLNDGDALAGNGGLYRGSLCTDDDNDRIELCL